MRYPSLLPVLVLSVLTGAIGTFAQATSGQNPITYPLGGSLDANVPVAITWTPTTKGTITINLLKGPPNNLVDLGPIAASVNNDGSFTWQIPNSLQDSGAMPGGDRYGFKIIDDLTKTFEYSPPFDLSVPGSTFGGALSSAASASVSSASVGTPSASSLPPTTTPTPTPTPTSIQETTSDVSTPTPTPTPTSAQTLSPTTATASSTDTSTTPTETQTQTQTPNPTAHTTAPATTTSARPNAAEILTPNAGPNMPLIIGATAGAFGGLAFLAVAIVMLVKCRRRRSMTRARGGRPLVSVSVHPPVEQASRGYNRV